MPERGLPRRRGGVRRGRQFVRSQLAYATRMMAAGANTGTPAAEPDARSDSPALGAVAGAADGAGAGSGEVKAQPAQRCLLVESAIRKATALGRQGHFQKAAQTLMQGPSLRLGERVMNQLHALHPSRAASASAANIHSPAASSNPIAVDRDVLTSIIKTKLANGSAPSLSGWTGELLLPLVDSAEAMDLLANIVSIILSGEVSDNIARLLLSSRLIPLAKPGSAPSNPRVRPIAWGETFYKLAAHYALHQCGGLDQVFAPVQLAVGVPGGVEVAVHMLRAAADVPGNLLVQLDITNAFNTRDRQRILDAVLARPELGPIARLF